MSMSILLALECYNIDMEIVNRLAFREYDILDKYEAGIVLTGPEGKSVKSGRLNFMGSYVKFLGDELFLINTNIPLYAYTKDELYEPDRSRKLLLSRKELLRLKTKLTERQNLTIVPLKCYTSHSFIKIQIALSKGRKQYQVKSVEKQRTIKRREKEQLKEYLKR